MGVGAMILTVVEAAGVAFVAGTAAYVVGLGVKSLRDRLREQDQSR